MLAWLVVGAAWAGDLHVDLLEAMNAARAQGGSCGTLGDFGPSGPLAPDGALARAAEAQASWIAATGRFGHLSPGGPLGETHDQRATAAGYRWNRVGEDLARGQDDPAKVVRDWLHSPSHCATLLDPRYEDVGVAVARDGIGNLVWAAELGRKHR